MKPPYELTPKILELILRISEKLGEVKATFISKPAPNLRKQNQVKTIHSSLQIEGNTLSTEQVTAVLEGKRVLGPEKDILEVQNAIAVYNDIAGFKANSEKSFLNAHGLLMNQLVDTAGSYRKKSAGIVRGSNLEHVAPPAENVPHLMKDLFSYLKNSQDSILIKSCVFHYEMEFIHPFEDGNGRMGRLWQTVLLMAEYPVFKFLPFESLILKSQSEYYSALSQSDKKGQSTPFIVYMLTIIDQAIADLLLNTRSATMNQQQRLEHFCDLEKSSFSRKDYMQVFKHISTATASRDLQKGIDLGLFTKSGDKRLTEYKLKTE